MLLQSVARILERHGFDWCACRGCFDIAARKRELMLFKVLDNVDSFQEEQACNLATLSDSLGAAVSLIGTHTRYERLRDSIIYERFSVPTFTPATLDAILDRRAPATYRDRGGLFEEIDPVALRKARTAAGISQQHLADAVGVTKKSIYEHESRRMRARSDVVARIEKLLGKKITVPFAHPVLKSDSLEPSSPFEKTIINRLRMIGFETEFVGQSPFNIVAEERVLIVSDAEQSPRTIERKAAQLEQFSDVSRKPLVVISETEPRTNLPAITAAELKNLDAHDLRKLAKK
ncbi:MAG: helix-turn-helix domain-containing protein [Candidatus Aenigmatarchaeota archaeon]